MHWLKSTTGVMPPQLQISLKKSTQLPTHLRERLCIVGYDWPQRVPFYQLQGPLFRNFLHVVPKLPGGFNPREVVLYRQMELIRTETVERMNELLEGVVDIVGIAGDSLTATTNTFSLCCCGSQDKQWLQNLLVLPFPAKNWISLEEVMILWKECLRVLLFHERDCCCNNRQWNQQYDQRNERWRNRKMALCNCSHVEQGDKEHNEESEQWQC